MNKWTSFDEDALQKLLKRKEAYEVTNKVAVENVVGWFYERGITEEEIVDGLIRFAEDVRDVLEPYDSGIRAARGDD